ncbi:MAG TPA: DUF2851 family protein [Candidatus Kapabacteria bacterium]|nr:DUF2851 family protein [Candidatus Kapabacteria bacterium]
MQEDELFYQKKVFNSISDPSSLFTTTSGKRLQFLSPGKIKRTGPDFEDIAILINGFLVVGDCEFHINSSDWVGHRHEDNDKYKTVILHIVLNNDTQIKGAFETLVLSKELLQDSSDTNTEESTPEVEEIQNFALLRLLRKTSVAKNLLNHHSLQDTLQILSQEFIHQYESKLHRPKYKQANLSNLIDSISDSELYNFVVAISENKSISIPDKLQSLVRTKLLNEGPHLRRELILNAVIPLVLSLANDENRINIFVWYWSTPALNSYGILNRKFPNKPQNFLWQQQGMLEYLREYGKRTNIIAESFRRYDFFEVLSFYKHGRLPLELLEN